MECSGTPRKNNFLDLENLEKTVDKTFNFPEKPRPSPLRKS